MNSTNTRNLLRQQVATHTITAGAQRVLEHLIERAMALTDADGAFVERAGDTTRPTHVIVSHGDGVPEPGATPPYRVLSDVSPARVALSAAGAHRGALVLIGTVTDAARTELDTLLGLAADALDMHALADEMEDRRQALENTVDDQFRLISGITYELRETLGAASEYVQLLDTESELTPQQRDYIASARRTIAAGLRLIGDLLELARVEAGRLPVQHEPTGVGPLLRDLARDHQLASATYGVQFEIDVPRDLPIAFTDPDLVGQILDTLLSNAVRYTPPNGRIRVVANVQCGQRAGDPPRWLRIAIIDSGPGVDGSHDVFEAVERVSGGRGAPGFRLAISRNVARLLGGDLTLETIPEPGACFALWLPLPD